MAKRSKKMNKKVVESIFSIVLLIILLLIAQTDFIQKDNNVQENTNLINEQTKKIGKTIVIGNENAESEADLRVFFIDVGEADSILITNNNESLLIDAGNNGDGKDIVNFIKSKGINKINYVVGTHPHEDHIGGLDDIINSFDIDNIYMPKIQTNTKTYEDVLKAIQNKNKTIKSFKKGDKFKVGNAEAEIMTDSILDSSNLNLSSNIIRLVFEGTSFLFTGDAETENENSINNWPKTDILKVGHHGSTTSTSQNFLNQINPKYAIISVGKDNDYGHPKEKILNRLKKIGAQILRTDEEGTIEIKICPKSLDS